MEESKARSILRLRQEQRDMESRYPQLLQMEAERKEEEKRRKEEAEAR